MTTEELHEILDDENRKLTADELKEVVYQLKQDILNLLLVKNKQRRKNKMAEKRGTLMTCDRCGDQLFLENIKTENDRIYRKDAPEGWFARNVGKTIICDYVLLCPECNRQCGQLLTDFMGGRRSLE